jgi:acetylornithine deacetylase/succinyl-diaminopimelate desuccinylase-like protein
MNHRDLEALLSDCIDFAQRLIRTPSMTYVEQPASDLVAAELRRLDFDEVVQDGRGNVHGRLFGADRQKPALVLNTHLDHVDPGDPTLWDYPPYAATIVDGRIIGRGACDIKGPLAVQVYAVAGLKRAGIVPPRDIVFSGVVEEEVGGGGAKYWVDHLDYPVALVLLGEPTSNQLSLGHRGIYAVWVTFTGHSVHASVPERGYNPNYALATFLSRLDAAASRLGTHTLLGHSTVSPTVIEVDTTSKNVTPAWTRVFLDFRSSTASPRLIHEIIAEAAAGLQYAITPGWDGLELPDSSEPLEGFYTPADSDIVLRTRSLLSEGLGQELPLSNYRFATDGRIIAPAGIPVLGFAPGEESQAHTANESIPIDMMRDSLRAHLHFLAHF